MNFNKLIKALNGQSKTCALSIAGKGGVGKSVIATNLAMACAQKGARVILFDANLGMGNIDILLGLHVKHSIQDFLAGECDLYDVLIPAAPNLYVLPAALGDEHIASLSHEKIDELIMAFSGIEDKPDFFIVDTPSGINENSIHFIAAAQEVMLVVNDEVTSMVDALAMIKVLREHQIYNFHITVNQVPNISAGKILFYRLKQEVARFEDVQLELASILVNDEKIHRAVQIQQPIQACFPASTLANSFSQLAEHVFNWPSLAHCSMKTQFFEERKAQ